MIQWQYSIKLKYNTYLCTLRLKIMRCVICDQEVDVNMLKKHMATIHRRTIQFDQELRHYLYSLKASINKKDFVCLQCNRSFPNNRKYYLHKFRNHNCLDYGAQQQQVCGAAADDDVEVIQQNQINAWRVMTYMVTPAKGRTDWEIYVAYYSFKQDYIMKTYIEENQGRRIASSPAVIIKLMKDANNKAVGANTQRIKNRVKLVPIIDRTIEFNKLVDRCPDYEATLVSVEDRLSIIQHDYEQDLNNLDVDSPYVPFELEKVNKAREVKMEIKLWTSVMVITISVFPLHGEEVWKMIFTNA